VVAVRRVVVVPRAVVVRLLTAVRPVAGIAPVVAAVPRVVGVRRVVAVRPVVAGLPVAVARIPGAGVGPARREANTVLVSAGTGAHRVARRQAAPVPGTSGGATGTGQGGSRALTARVAGPKVAERETRSRPAVRDRSDQARVHKAAADPQRRRDRGPQERRQDGPAARRDREPEGRQERAPAARRERAPAARREHGPEGRRDRGPERDQAGRGPSSATPMAGGLRCRPASRPTSSTRRPARS
jgi:hypothetical protein